mmetsp:Transcript_6084/g.13606  ORF Transcript_6084/g.13606 Transcript_6084/m.13606 type:complete len:172 (-) Transcript_6084:2278-2793(-)
MPRAFSPPDTLSKEDIRTIADVRRGIWNNAFWGMGVGSLSGVVAHSLGQFGQSRLGLLKGTQLNRNTALLTFLGGGALGSFLMATTAGKNQVHHLHPIFEVGKRELPPTETPYQQAISTDKPPQESQDDNLLDIEKRKHNRFLRRTTLRQRLESSGHVSLSPAEDGKRRSH